MIAGETRPAETIVATQGVDADTVVAQLGNAVHFALVHIEVAILACKGKDLMIVEVLEVFDRLCGCIALNEQDLPSKPSMHLHSNPRSSRSIHVPLLHGLPVQ